MYSVVLEVEILFILVTVAVLSSMLQKRFTIQNAVSSCVVGCIERKCVLRVIVKSSR